MNIFVRWLTGVLFLSAASGHSPAATWYDVPGRLIHSVDAFSEKVLDFADDRELSGVEPSSDSTHVTGLVTTPVEQRNIYIAPVNNNKRSKTLTRS